MKIVTQDLKSALSHCVSVIDRKPDSFVMECVEIKNDGTVTAAGSGMYAISKIPGMQGDGSALWVIDAARLFSLVNNLYSDIDLYQDKDKISLISGKSRYKISCVEDMRSFPTPPAPPESHIRIKAGCLKDAMSWTIATCSKNDARYYLRGIYFDADQIVSTDGHRLSYQKITDIGHSFILPRNAAEAILKMLSGSRSDEDFCYFAMTEHGNKKLCHFDINGNTLISGLIDGNFPDYRKVIPSKEDFTAVFDKDLFRSALNRLGSFSALDRKCLMAFSMPFENAVIKTAASKGEGEEEIEISSMTGKTNEFEIGFNVDYLIQAVSSCASEHVEMIFYGRGNAAKIVDAESGRFQVIMPIRV